MRAVDTNVLVRLVTRDDSKQVVSAEAFVEKGAWVSQLVLAETTWVLEAAYGLEHEAIAMAIDMMLNHQSLTVQDADVVAAALDRYRRKPVLGFSDCLVLEIARKAGHTPLGTFDRNLSKLEGTQRL
ncbi:MAG TPA: type II toxin-antitoxin system VapC family toxin [Thermoanaerobaculia bacterium]|nr:type II toxin-antitoxin system VapC family toxin [Thermoanaerobaculia bacterium]